MEVVPHTRAWALGIFGVWRDVLADLLVSDHGYAFEDVNVMFLARAS